RVLPVAAGDLRAHRLREALDDCEAKARAALAVGAFDACERVECALALDWKSGPLILDDQSDLAPDVRSRDPDRAGRTRMTRGIVDQVDEAVVKELGVGLHERQVDRQVDRDLSRRQTGPKVLEGGGDRID